MCIFVALKVQDFLQAKYRSKRTSEGQKDRKMHFFWNVWFMLKFCQIIRSKEKVQPSLSSKAQFHQHSMHSFYISVKNTVKSSVFLRFWDLQV